MVYNKLVRDKIPDIIRESGSIPITNVADDLEYQKKLFNKLQEEVDEFIEDSNPEELADILEVIYAICDCLNIGRATLDEIRKEKYNKRGGFKEKIILIETK